MMKKVMRIVSVFLALGFFLFLNSYIGSNNMGVLNPKGVIAVAEKNLLVTTVLLMMVVIIPVFIMLFSFAWRYRAGNKKAKYTPDWQSNLALEIIWWTIPIVIIAIIGTITWKSSHDLDPFRPLESKVKPVTIEVVALDWKWLFIYPEEHIATVNFLVLPKNTPINFKITSDAPMNAFWIPQLGSQIYAMAGMTAKLHLMANEEGVYKGVSSNFSGDGFSGMRFDTNVVSEEEYVTWVNNTRTVPNVLTEEAYNNLAQQTKNNPVELYSSVKDNLYDWVIMKYMPPNDTLTNIGDTMPSKNIDMRGQDMGTMNSH